MYVYQVYYTCGMYTYNILTIASFRIGVPSILFFYLKMFLWIFVDFIIKFNILFVNYLLKMNQSFNFTFYFGDQESFSLQWFQLRQQLFGYLHFTKKHVV